MLPEPSEKPLRLGLYVTERCNLRCEFCFTHKYKGGREKHPDISLDVVDRVFEVFGRFQHVMVGGPGEPMAHPQFPDIIGKVLNHADRVSITTNGTKTRDIKNAVPWEHLHRINLSFPEIDEERYKEVTRTSLFESARWALRFLQENAAPVVPNVVIGANNVHRIEQYVRFMLDHGVRRMVLQPLVNYKDYLTDEEFFWKHSLVEENTEVMAALDEQKRAVETLTEGKKFKLNWPTIVSKNRIGRGCNMALQYLAVNGNGDVALCCRGEGPRAELGNLRDGKDLWTSPTFQEFRRRVFAVEERHPKCKTCHAAYDRGTL